MKSICSTRGVTPHLAMALTISVDHLQSVTWACDFWRQCIPNGISWREWLNINLTATHSFVSSWFSLLFLTDKLWLYRQITFDGKTHTSTADSYIINKYIWPNIYGSFDPYFFWYLQTIPESTTALAVKTEKWIKTMKLKTKFIVEDGRRDGWLDGRKRKFIILEEEELHI